MARAPRPYCSWEGCLAKVKIGGRCHKHHEEAVAIGLVAATRMCLWEGCDRPAAARDLCGKHYWHFRFKGEFPVFEGDEIVWERAHEYTQERLAIAQATYKLRRVVMWLTEPRVRGAYPDFDLEAEIDTALDILERGPLPHAEEEG